jgi:hypothetical protein
MPNHDVEGVPMNDEVAATVCTLVDGSVCYFDATEVCSQVVPQELVMIAGDIDETDALPDLAQELLDDVVVLLRPVPGCLKPPAVNDIADKVDGVGVDLPQKVEEHPTLATLCPKMDIRNEQSAILQRIVRHVENSPLP